MEDLCQLLRATLRSTEASLCIYMCVYILYIYIDSEREREKPKYAVCSPLFILIVDRFINVAFLCT